MHAIEVENVTKIYRKGFRAVRVPAVVNLSFSVRQGTITGFVGPNGAGKTTTIKMIIGLVQPTAGALRLNGADASQLRARKGVAFLSEQPYFYTHLSVAEMLRFTGSLIGLTAAQARDESKRVLEVVELSHKAAAKIRELSKGMQQRLNMAQALLGNPHTLILDEPMSGMDPPGRRLFREIMVGLRREEKTLFFSTHVLDDIESLCDDVVVLDKGALTCTGGVRTLLEEGFLGTDITVPASNQSLGSALQAAGYPPEYHPDTGEWILFVPRERDVTDVLRMLNEYQVFPRSIMGRTMTLESLLYRKQTGGEA